MYALDHNRIIKYADDTTLLVALKSSVDVATEFGHLEDWSRPGSRRPDLGPDVTNLQSTKTRRLK